MPKKLSNSIILFLFILITIMLVHCHFFFRILAGQERLGRRECLQEQDQRDEQEAGGQSKRVGRATYKEQIKNEITEGPAGAIT